MNYTVKIQSISGEQEVDVVLNGITVVCGENGSGKSALAHALYKAFHVLDGETDEEEIQDAIYTDAADCFDYSEPRRPSVSRVHLESLCRRDPVIRANNKLLQTLKCILHGEVQVSRYGAGGGIFLRCTDKAKVPWPRMPKGMKAFVILYQLIRNACLTGHTLLIIDKPETYLHPRLIVEYARMIVLLRKRFRTKFFITTHSPDMVSALKHIGAKEEADVQFYLAESQPDGYVYRSLGQDVGPIFKSFNTALDLIEKYGD